MGHTIYISVGSNVDRETNTRAGLDALAKVFERVRLSTVYESEAVGFQGSHFYNLVVEANTTMPIEEVCKALKEIEDNNGRIRGDKKFAPRTLDLDLLLYDDVITSEGVQLPREEICFNAFVLLPLSELAPETQHPIEQKTYAALWQNMDKSKQKLWPIEFTWSEPRS